MASWYKLFSTRFKELGFRNMGDHWRLVALDDDPDGEKCTVVGPQYHSKAELLADLERYARENWGLV
jgi:hypothetical protein